MQICRIRIGNLNLKNISEQGEPDRAEKSEAWQTAIGLQAVDGLNTSEYLLDTAKEHIEGKITIDEAQKRIHSYYEQRTARTETENEQPKRQISFRQESRSCWEKKRFSFPLPSGLPFTADCLRAYSATPDRFRQYNITKKEWVLNGDTVIYADWNSIKENLGL